MTDLTLYQRLDGYDGLVAFVDSLLPRLQKDKKLSRFWKNRGADGVAREKQLLINYLCHVTGGPVLYTGRDMRVTHKGMGIDSQDWAAFLDHAGATMEELEIPIGECDDVVAFILSLKDEIVDGEEEVIC